MKIKAMWLYSLVAAAAAITAQTCQAWHVYGTVLCPSGTPYANVTIDVTGSSTCGGAFSGTTTTDSGGNYLLNLPDCNGCYSISINSSTLPAGATITSPSGPDSFCLTTNDDVEQVNFTVSSSLCGTPPPPPCQPVGSCSASNFNGTPVAQGNFIWFNSVFNVKGLNNRNATIEFDGSEVSFTVNGTPVTVNIPPAIITFSTSATIATTTFDDGTGTWQTTVPANYNGNVFLSGTSYQLPFYMPGGVNPVTWCGDFSANTSGLQVQWQWGAAVYGNPCAISPNGYNGLEVKPIDGPQQNSYNNGDHAGTPEYSGKMCVLGGARGGGGSNWTGSYSGTVSANLCPGGVTN